MIRTSGLKRIFSYLYIGELHYDVVGQSPTVGPGYDMALSSDGHVVSGDTGPPSRYTDQGINFQMWGSVSCIYCGQSFLTKKLLLQHKAKVHGIQVKEVSCKVCGKLFTSRSGLYLHSKTAHGSGKGCPQCDICGKLLGSQSRLERHRRTHVQTSLCCGLCGKNFRTEKSLSDHVCINNQSGTLN